MYCLKKVCVTCCGTGKVFDYFNPKTWIPFNYNVRPIIKCRTCNGKGYTLSPWHDRRRMS